MAELNMNKYVFKQLKSNCIDFHPLKACYLIGINYIKFMKNFKCSMNVVNRNDLALRDGS